MRIRWNKWWNIALIAIVGAAIALPCPLAARAEADIQVIAFGTAIVEGGNTAGVRQKATQDALRQALEQGVGMMMDSVSILKNDDLMDKVYTNTQGYITSYEIIQEKQEANGLYKLKIKALVKPGALKDTLARLGIIKAMMDYPRIMVIPSPGKAGSLASRAAETTLSKDFTDKSFDLVDSASSEALHKEIGKLAGKGITDNAAADLGLKHCAEIVILCTVETGAVDFDGIMEKAPVSLSIKAVTATEGKILASDSTTVTGVGQNKKEALRNGGTRAAEGISERVIQSILTWWADYVANGMPYIITLNTPPGSDRQVLAFQQVIESIPGVVSLTERSSGGGITEMMAKYKGNSMLLKREIITECCATEGLEELQLVASKGRFMVFEVK